MQARSCAGSQLSKTTHCTRPNNTLHPARERLAPQHDAEEVIGRCAVKRLIACVREENVTRTPFAAELTRQRKGNNI